MNNRYLLNLILLGTMVLALCLLPGCSSEQKQQTAEKQSVVPIPAPLIVEDSSRVADRIRQLESDLIEAYKHGDTLTLDRLLHPYYSVGLPGGGGFGDKVSEIAGAKNLVVPGYILENDTMQVMVESDVAIVTKLLRQEIPVMGKKQTSQSLWTNTWVKRNEEWQLLASQGTFLMDIKK